MFKTIESYWNLQMIRGSKSLYDKNTRKTKEEPKEKKDSMHFQSGNIVMNNGTDFFLKKDECDTAQ